MAAKKKPAAKKSAAKKPKARKPVVRTPRKASYKFTWVLAEKILTQIACGQTLNTVCKQSDMPDRDTVSSWLYKGVATVDEDLRAFAEGFALACRVRVALMEEDYIDLMREIQCMEPIQMTMENATKQKLLMDGFKWYLTKFRMGAQLSGTDQMISDLRNGSEQKQVGFRLVYHGPKGDE